MTEKLLTGTQSIVSNKPNYRPTSDMPFDCGPFSAQKRYAGGPMPTVANFICLLGGGGGGGAFNKLKYMHGQIFQDHHECDQYEKTRI